MISRRAFLTRMGIASAALAAAAASEPGRRDPLRPLWEAWKTVHVSSSGRVIDRLQDNVSHSEGQGYALVIAEALGDRDGFELILDWTMANLAVRPGDSLLAWRWHPAGGGRVTDPNNASDGDLFAAWALVRAGRRFREPRWREAGRAIAADLVRHCLRPHPGRRDGALLLLPGAAGFETPEGLVVNPAYYMLRAMADLADEAEQPPLRRCADDGADLLTALARKGLVPDWTLVGPSGLGPAPGKSDTFGYEAMRVPLYLVWSRRPEHEAVSRAGNAYAATSAAGSATTPTIVEASSGRVLETSDDPGYRALAALALCAAQGDTGGLMPAFNVGQPYYPGMLHLLSLVAQRETALGCTL